MKKNKLIITCIIVIGIITLSINNLEMNNFQIQKQATNTENTVELKEIDEAALDLFYDIVNVDIKESEYSYSGEIIYDQTTLLNEDYKTILSDNGYDIENLYISIKIGDNDILKGTLTLQNINNYDEFIKTFEINYSNSSDYNEDDYNYVIDKLNSLDTSHLEKTYNEYLDIYEYYHYEYVNSIEELGKKMAELSTIETLEDVLRILAFGELDIASLINDEEISIVPSNENQLIGSMCGGVETTDAAIESCSGTFRIYKNDISYQTINITKAYKTVIMNTMKETEEIFVEMKELIEEYTTKDIIGAFEAIYKEAFEGKIEVGFSVGDEYNDQYVVVLHKKQDDSIEKFFTIVVDGYVMIEVEEFSPFMIALIDEEDIPYEDPNAVDSSNIESGSYIIGTHMFTKDSNDIYDGLLNTTHIMLAAKTIVSDDLEDMIIYYKNPRGIWINALTSEEIDAPDEFKIDYENLIEKTNI